MPAHAKRAEWPVAERTAALDREMVTGRRERDLGRALIAFTALVILATAGGVLAAFVFGPDPVRWVWP